MDNSDFTYSANIVFETMDFTYHVNTLVSLIIQ